MSALSRTALTAVLLAACGSATAELSANAGWVSDYYFRGLLQHSSSASAGLDYEENGFYAGTWAADVGDGLEVDGYLGWQGEFEDISLSAGFTGYYYTGDFDDTYQEVNLGFGYQFASVDVAIGEYENFTGPTLDYTYYALTLEHEGFFGRYAGFSRDFDGDYFELGYSTELEGFDLAIALLSGDYVENGESGEALTVGISKAFQIN